MDHSEVYKDIKHYAALLGNAVEKKDMLHMTHLVDMMEMTLRPVTDKLAQELYSLISIGDTEGAILLITKESANPLEAVKIAEKNGDYAAALAILEAEQACHTLDILRDSV